MMRFAVARIDDEVGGPLVAALLADLIVRYGVEDPDEPAPEELAPPRGTFLVVFGEDDGLIFSWFLHGGTTRGVAEGGTRLLPRGRLVMIPRAGHMVQFERPVDFDAALLEFLKEAP